MLPRRYINRLWRKRRYNKYSRHINVSFAQRFGTMFSLLFLLIVLHTVAMIVFESQPLGDALWLTLTTITTVGYGDFSAMTFFGRLSSTLLLYAVGIALLAQLGAEYVEYRLTIRDKKQIGRWKWKKMKNHILIVNIPNEDPLSYLERLIGQIRQTPELCELPVQILCEQFPGMLPESLSSLGVVHYTGTGQSSDDLISAHAQYASYIVVLAAAPSHRYSDSLAFDLLSRLDEIGTEAMVLAEVCRDENRERISAMGADVVLRPVRAYPGMVVRSMMAPGTEAVFENLFSYNDDHMKRFDVRFSEQPWSEIVCKLVLAGAGTPIAFIEHSGEIDVNPLPETRCSGQAIITMVSETQQVTAELVDAALRAMQR